MVLSWEGAVILRFTGGEMDSVTAQICRCFDPVVFFSDYLEQPGKTNVVRPNYCCPYPLSML